MQTCATTYRTKFARTTAESVLILLLVELMLHVRPCAMEMPALLAALLQDGTGSGGVGGGGSLHGPGSLTFDEFPAAVAGSKSLEAANDERRKELLNEAVAAFDEQEAKNIEDFEALLPPLMATESPPKASSAAASPQSSSSAALLEAMSHAIAAKNLLQRHCSIEIVTKVPGICQNMPHAFGSACVAGDYMDVFNMECMKQRN